MDQTLVDLTDAPENLETGEKVTLIGKQQNEEILLTQLSEDAGSIPWSYCVRLPNGFEGVHDQSAIAWRPSKIKIGLNPRDHILQFFNPTRTVVESLLAVFGASVGRNPTHTVLFVSGMNFLQPG